MMIYCLVVVCSLCVVSLAGVIIASEASLMYELAGAILWYIYIKTEKTF